MRYSASSFKYTIYKYRIYLKERFPGYCSRYSDFLPHVGSWIESRWEQGFQHPSRPAPGADPASCAKGPGSFLGVKWSKRATDGRSVVLTAHLLLVARATPPPIHCVCSVNFVSINLTTLYISRSRHIFQSHVYWTLHHLDSWIKIVTCFIISLFTAQHVSNVSTSIFRSFRLIVDLSHGLYCSGSMCVGVTAWFGWGGVVSLCRLKQ